jgi:hypothetical protein
MANTAVAKETEIFAKMLDLFVAANPPKSNLNKETASPNSVFLSVTSTLKLNNFVRGTILPQCLFSDSLKPFLP